MGDGFSLSDAPIAKIIVEEIGMKTVKRRGLGDLNKIYRPCRIDEVVGNITIKRMIKNALDNQTLPHSLLFTGPSGCGKTTMARLVALGLNCVNGPTANPCCVCDFCRP